MNLEQLESVLAGPITCTDHTTEEIAQHIAERYEQFPYHERSVYLFPQARAFGDREHIISIHGRSSGAVPEHIYQYVLLTYCYKGTFRMNVDGTSIALAQGDCIVLDRNVPHAVEPTDDGTFAVNIILHDRFFLHRMSDDTGRLNAEFPNELLNTGSPHTDYHTYRTAGDEFAKTLVDYILCEHFDPRLGSPSIIDDLIAALLNHLFRTFEGTRKTQQEIDKRSELMGEIQEYISRHYSEGNLGEMAKDLGYESSYLSTAIRKATGHTFKQLVNDARMRHAMTLLQGSDISVTDIAYAVGITNLTQFYKRFRDFAGCTPKEYRSHSKR